MSTFKIAIVAFFFIFLIAFVGGAKADALTEAKYEIKEFTEEKVPAIVDGAKELPAKTKSWFNTEVEKTKEFQKKGWADTRKQIDNTKKKIKGFLESIKPTKAKY